MLAGIQKKDQNTGNPSTDQLVHELQVYQAELEMQNEELRSRQKALDDSRQRYFSLFENAPAGYVILDQSGIIRQMNRMFATLIQADAGTVSGKAFADLLHPEDAVVFRSRFRPLFRNPADKQLEARIVAGRSGKCHVLISAARHGMKIVSTGDDDHELLLMVMDITERKQIEEENRQLIVRLNEALGQVKQLTGLLPICSHCKKIRDDKGYWQEVEVYIHNHSEARFSHGICRECMRKHYPDFEVHDI